MKKLCRRKTIIRDRDYLNGYEKLAYSTGYTNVYWTPISLDLASKEILVLILKEKLKGLPIHTTQREDRYRLFSMKDIDNENLRIYISYLIKNHHIYNDDYFKYDLKFEGDHIYMRYRKNTPWTVLGIATLEREYEI